MKWDDPIGFCEYGTAKLFVIPYVDIGNSCLFQESLQSMI